MTIGIAWFVTLLILAAVLGVLAGSLGASSGKGDDLEQVSEAIVKARSLEREVASQKSSRDMWKSTAEEIRGQRDDAYEALVRTADTLDWLVEEVPGLDGALEWPTDTAEIVYRVEALQEDLGRQDATSAWREFRAGGH